MANTPREAPMPLQIPNLVTPLGENPQRVFQKGDYNEETTDGREVGTERLRVDLNEILDLGGDGTNLRNGVVRGAIGGSVATSLVRGRTNVGGVGWRRAIDIDAAGHYERDGSERMQGSNLFRV